MSDYRTSLYEKYVSKFKEGSASHIAGDLLLYYFRWCENKILPFINDVNKTEAILEIGCGPGYILEFLQLNGFTNVKGIDIAQEQIDIAVERGCDAEVHDVFEFLQTKNEAFETIIALDFVEHFHKEELMKLIPLLFKSLKKGGKLILQTPNGEGLFPRQIIYGDLTHSTIFTPNSLRQILTLHGFQSFQFTETGHVPNGSVKNYIRLKLWSVIKLFANTVRKIETGKSQFIWTENMICCCQKPS